MDAPAADHAVPGILDQLAKVYGEMLSLAAAGQWDAMLELDVRRDELARRLGTASRLTPDHRPRLEEIQRLNDQLQRQVIAGRGKTLASLGKVAHGQRMRRTYEAGGRTSAP